MGKIGTIKGIAQEGSPAARRAQPGAAVWIAIDISRSKLVYCVRWDGAEQRRLSTPFGLSHVGAVVEQYSGCQLHVAYEACGFGYELAWWLESQHIGVTVIAPSRMERAPGAQVKTDRVDVGKMARKLEKGELKGIYVPPRSLHEHRQLGRTYAQCRAERQRAQIRIRMTLQEHGHLGPLPSAGWKAYETWLPTQSVPVPVQACIEAHQRLRAAADQQLRGLRARLKTLAHSEPYRGLITALCAQPGVGWLSAMRLVLEIGDIGRFATTDSFPYYLGLTPSQYSSGELDHRGHILKWGPAELRALLLQCAWSAVRAGRDAELKERFERLHPRLGRKRAIVAVARQLAIRLRRRWMTYLSRSESAAASAA
jgi:transposase